MKLQLPSACAPVVLLEGQVPLILRLGPYHSGLCLFKPWTLCCMSSPLSLSLPSILSKNKGKPPPPQKTKNCAQSLYGVYLPRSLADSLHAVTLKYFWSNKCRFVPFRCDRVLQCYRTHLTPTLLPTPLPPHTGIDCLLQLALFYIIDDARFYPAMAALQRNMSLIWYFKRTCHWAESLCSAIA